MGKREAPSERDRFWLDHEAAVAKSGQTAKAYVAERGLSLHAFYQARKRLRAHGLLKSPRAEARPANSRIPKFSKVEFVTPQRSGEFRLGLPNGLTLEWSGSELPAAMVDLLERLIQAR